MARLSKNNRKYMSKPDMIKSLVKIYELYSRSEVPLANVHILLDHFLWGWTEFEGKYKGCKWWSENAYNQFINSKKETAGLIHEHVVPRNVIRVKFLEMLDNGCNEEELYRFLYQYLFACIITKEEDHLLRNSGFKNQLGQELHKETIWYRYEQAKIKVKQISW
ncbi:hypothetical protein [Sediminibacillus albus]|uniref:Uncharacterized protein n=1 Tax=Sediminibacillus albus TaxID=407036 RepID=A0A1G8X6M2_9BACI|nr:hypothetical protein [Sediminibacillus albus]SDJ86037.1 hypothetical protein SAMN05216243_1183 [Sediminibacillus albus]